MAIPYRGEWCQRCEPSSSHHTHRMRAVRRALTPSLILRCCDHCLCSRRRLSVCAEQFGSARSAVRRRQPSHALLAVLRYAAAGEALGAAEGTPAAARPAQVRGFPRMGAGACLSASGCDARLSRGVRCAVVAAAGGCYPTTAPFKAAGCLPLSYSGNAGVSGVSYRGEGRLVGAVLEPQMSARRRWEWLWGGTAGL